MVSEADRRPRGGTCCVLLQHDRRKQKQVPRLRRSFASRTFFFARDDRVSQAVPSIAAPLEVAPFQSFSGRRCLVCFSGKNHSNIPPITPPSITVIGQNQIMRHW